MTSTEPHIQIRRLQDPTNAQITAILLVMREAFAPGFALRATLGSEASAAQIDALHVCYVRAALVDGEGELWVAEVERPEVPGEKAIVGVTLCFPPGSDFLSSARQRAAAGLRQFHEVVGEQRARWFLDYYVAGIDALWKRCAGDAYMASYKLAKLAVLPEYRAFGIASELSRPVIERAARERKRVFGYGTSEKHVLGYKAVGCEILGATDFKTLTPVVGPAGEEKTSTLRVWGIGITPAAWADEEGQKEETITTQRGMAKL
ncbi:hypothetical protein CALCODRAFT_485053 [Calocera cornea HHB12733]|uniref:N-acetyltransferase domain-containing protein n=1 Tax=Calocera cornea HHB12733 TaxID=1353952 RepID=A0A165ELQ7_9BASI|nr:hypothetical protein CALCODRAFT_485053 [Calocera cornea HHB12733]